jgi:hypothetical protein
MHRSSESIAALAAALAKESDHRRVHIQRVKASAEIVHSLCLFVSS